MRFSSFEVVSGEYDESEDGRTITAATEKGLFEFRLMQCVNCHGNGVPYQEGIEGHGAYCPVCRGDGNRSLWRCDAWPGVGFVMPGSERPFTITIDEVANARFDEWLNDTNREIATALGVPPELVAGGR